MPQNPRQRSWYSTAARVEGAALSVAVDWPTRRLMATISQRILDESGEVRAVCATDLALDEIWALVALPPEWEEESLLELASKIDSNTEGEKTLEAVRRSDTVPNLASRTLLGELTRTNSDDELEALLDSKPSGIELSELKGEPVLWAWSRAGQSAWLVIAVPTHVIF